MARRREAPRPVQLAASLPGVAGRSQRLRLPARSRSTVPLLSPARAGGVDEPRRAEAGAALTAAEVAARHPGFRPIVDALRRPQGPQAKGGAAAPVRVPVRVEMPADLLNGKPSLALVFPVPETGWKLVQVSPRGELEQAAGRISRSLLLLISGILLAVLLPAYLFLSRRWIMPVTTLAEAATLVRDGELDVRVSMPGRDEIAELADSFNQMVDQLAANTAGLKRANVELRRTLGLTDTIMGARCARACSCSPLSLRSKPSIRPQRGGSSARRIWRGPTFSTSSARSRRRAPRSSPPASCACCSIRPRRTV